MMNKEKMMQAELQLVDGKFALIAGGKKIEGLKCPNCEAFHRTNP